MYLFSSLQTALANLRANKLRSALTMLGVIIGVSAVIVMVSIVEGARSKVTAEFERLGSNLIIVAYDPSAEDRKTGHTIDGLTMGDVAAIRDRCDLVQSISAEMPVGEIKIQYMDREMQVRANGVQPDYAHLRNVSVAKGRFISDSDIASWAKVGVIGEKVKQELFGNEDPIGRDVNLQGVSFTVIGVLEQKGRSGDEDTDKAVLGPITTIQKRFIGRDTVGMVWAQPCDPTQIDATMDQIWQCVQRRYGNNLPGLRVDNLVNIQNAIGRILSIFGIVLGSIAGLALLVGGIGIMNIMLVSVTERTREIGIRKAVGARKRDVLSQFLIESATLSGTGGLMGIGIGAGVAHLIGAISRQLMKGGMGGDPGIPIHLPAWAVLGAFAFSAGVGIIFGVYPAMRAASLDPIEALRHE